MAVATDVGIGIAAISATASAASAYISKRTNDRGAQAVVRATIERLNTNLGPELLVQLHNDGLGTAYSVSCKIRTADVDNHGRTVFDTQFPADHRGELVRYLDSRHSFPPDSYLNLGLSWPDDDVFWMVIRWNDDLGVRWELIEHGTKHERQPRRRLRASRWQRWRPEADW